MTLLPREIGVVRVTRLSRDKFTKGNIRGYVKKKKKKTETAHDIKHGKSLGFFDTPGKRANQVSLFDTNLKPQKNCFFQRFSLVLFREKSMLTIMQISRYDKSNREICIGNSMICRAIWHKYHE